MKELYLMSENTIEKAVKRYSLDACQENYAKVIHEIFWGIVNGNKIYYIVDKDHAGEHVPTIVRDAEGKLYSAIFSHRSTILETQSGDIIEENFETFARHILLKFDIMGLLLDMDIGGGVVVMTDYLVTILGAVQDYRNSIK